MWFCTTLYPLCCTLKISSIIWTFEYAFVFQFKSLLWHCYAIASLWKTHWLFILLQGHFGHYTWVEWAQVRKFCYFAPSLFFFRNVQQLVNVFLCTWSCVSSGRYLHFAEQLTACGFGVYAMDWIGKSTVSGFLNVHMFSEICIYSLVQELCCI